MASIVLMLLLGKEEEEEAQAEGSLRSQSL